tara:strand:+ start:4504 stop:5853 length:1350 start_codon:yes stop_codon:yes gene_type:complete
MESYLRKHNLKKSLEHIVNHCFEHKLEFPYEYIKTYCNSYIESIIVDINASSVFDSKGQPTVKVQVTTNKGKFYGISPSGISTGIYEEIENRDDKVDEYFGKGVKNTILQVNEKVRQSLIGKNPKNQNQIDKILIEANIGILGRCAMSVAICKAGAAEYNIEPFEYVSKLSNQDANIPVPMFNILNGGSHADNELAFQSYMIVPSHSTSFEDSLRIGTETYFRLKDKLSSRYGCGNTNVGEQGGFAPRIKDNIEALEMINEVIEPGTEIGIDVAASEFYMGEDEDCYDLEYKVCENDGSKYISPQRLNEIYLQILSKFPINFIEDPYQQSDKERTSILKNLNKCTVIADDMISGNIEDTIFSQTCNGISVNLTQTGTITKTIENCCLVKQAGWKLLISDRGAETEDTFLADFAVGIGAYGIKAGAPCRSERVSKYNRLLEIYQGLAKPV